jgi:hypothetical protein
MIKSYFTSSSIRFVPRRSHRSVGGMRIEPDLLDCRFLLDNRTAFRSMRKQQVVEF